MAYEDAFSFCLDLGFLKSRLLLLFVSEVLLDALCTDVLTDDELKIT